MYLFSKILKYRTCGFVASNMPKLDEHKKDVHGKKVCCGVCYDFVFPESCWRIYREHHHQQHPQQEFADCLLFETSKPSELSHDLEDWQVPPVDGFLELGNPLSA